MFVVTLITEISSALYPILTSYLAGQLTTQLYEAVKNHQDTGKVYPILIGLGLLGVFYRALQSLLRVIQSIAGDKLRISVREKLIAKFTNLPIAQYEEKVVMDRLERVRSFSSNVSWVLDTIISIGGTLTGVVAAGIALASISPLIGGVVVAALIPLAILNQRIRKKHTEEWKENSTNRFIANDIESQLLQPRIIPELRLYGLVDFFLARVRELRMSTVTMERRQERQRALYSNLENITETIVTTGALLWVVGKIIVGNLEVGKFVFFQQVIERFSGQISSLLNQLTSREQELSDAHDFMLFMQEADHPGGETRLPEAVPTIALQNVSFSYPGAKHRALEDVSLTITPGERIAFVGENGAGKSTLIKLILGFYEPSNGRVLVDEIPMQEVFQKDWLAKVGVLFQHFEHFPFTTVAENIRLGRVQRETSEEAIQEALSLAKADSFVNKLSHGTGTYLNKWTNEENGTDLSGGQWQRIALARNFYRNPQVIVLDEPTSAMDAQAEFDVFKNLLESKELQSMIIVSHRFSTVRKADRIYVLEAGKITEQGTHGDLMKLEGTYARLYRQQAESYQD